MKRCPECGRDYNDDSLSFCLDDGARLLEGPASGDEPATAIFYSDAPEETPTRDQISTSEAKGAKSQVAGATTSAPEFVRRIIHNRFALVAGLALILLGMSLAVYFRGRENGAAIDSIAVLPFENRSADAETEYLSDGLTESLIYRLFAVAEP